MPGAERTAGIDQHKAVALLDHRNVAVGLDLEFRLGQQPHAFGDRPHDLEIAGIRRQRRFTRREWRRISCENGNGERQCRRNRAQKI